MSVYFIDFEASSLEPDSYPIEVAWVDQAGQGEGYLIKPAPAWRGRSWSAVSQAMHGITRELLQAEGRPHDQVAGRIAATIGAGRVYASSNWDGAWMQVLLDAAGLDQRVDVRDVAELYGQLCQPLRDRPGMAATIIRNAESAEAMRPRAQHRALPDAEALWWVARDIKNRVALLGDR